MATYTTNIQVDFSEDPSFSSAEPTVLSLTSSQMRLQTPSGNTQVYGGSFSYTYSGGYQYLDWNNSWLNSIAEYSFYDGSLIASVTGINMSGALYQSYALANDGNGLTLYVFRGNDSISGSSFDDLLCGFAGNDTINGRSGYDIANYSGTKSQYTLAMNGNGVWTITDNVGGRDGMDTLTGIEVLQFLDQTYVLPAINVITGTDGAEILNGTTDADEMHGLGGNDVLNGGTGADIMIGGSGNDTYFVENRGDVVTENPVEGTDTVKSSITYTLSSNVESLILTGTRAINGIGNALHNQITGNNASNTLNGYSGNDTLDGGLGSDIMVGGLGNDTFYVDNTGDVTTEGANEGIDTVISSINHTLGSNLENLILTGTTAINGTGNQLANILTGNSAANILDGGLGVDKLAGRQGNDTYYVDTADDVVTELANSGIDTVCSTVNRTLGTNQENLTLIGTSAIKGTGNAVNNTIIGNSANNVLNGGLGNDSLTGGDGKDTFLFSSIINGVTNLDRIEDFIALDDTIKLNQTIFSSLTTLGTLKGTGCFRASTDGAALDSNDYILYNTTSGALFYDADGNGTGAEAIQFAILVAKPAITAADFVVVDIVQQNFTLTNTSAAIGLIGVNEFAMSEASVGY